MNDAAIDRDVTARHDALIDWFEPILAARGTILDHAQAAALDRLQELGSELEAFRAARQSTLKKLFLPPDVPRGVFLWGGVGAARAS
jgi:cell division protein ZapE